MKETAAVVAAALIASELLVLVFHTLFFDDRLRDFLLLTALVVLMVATPLGYWMTLRTARFARMASEACEASKVDDLTQLLNRGEFMKRAHAALAEAGGSAGALLFIDADHFKAINDTCGHAAGDAALREIGSMIRSAIPFNAVAGRMGGEEFAVFLPGADCELALDVSERIRFDVRRISCAPFLPAGWVSVSIGIAEHVPGQELDDLLEKADNCLYEAKDQGRDRIVRSIADAA